MLEATVDFVGIDNRVDKAEAGESNDGGGGKAGNNQDEFADA
jgi:hypothetical protein